MDSSFWFDTINLKWSNVYISRYHIFQVKIVFLSLMIVFVLAKLVKTFMKCHIMWYFIVCQSMHLRVSTPVYCKLENFRDNFIFTNSIKRHICDVKNSLQDHDLPTFIRTLARISEFTVQRVNMEYENYKKISSFLKVSS